MQKNQFYDENLSNFAHATFTNIIWLNKTDSNSKAAETIKKIQPTVYICIHVFVKNESEMNQKSIYMIDHIRIKLKWICTHIEN